MLQTTSHHFHRIEKQRCLLCQVYFSNITMLWSVSGWSFEGTFTFVAFYSMLVLNYCSRVFHSDFFEMLWDCVCGGFFIWENLTVLILTGLKPKTSDKPTKNSQIGLWRKCCLEGNGCSGFPNWGQTFRRLQRFTFSSDINPYKTAQNHSHRSHNPTPLFAA